MILQAPFPWFGGKRRVASVVWDFFGNVPNYVEPFFGSGAVLLNRPHVARCETVNDLDCYLANFWRAVAADPEQIAYWADWPVNEADLRARHRWLVEQCGLGFQDSMRSDPHFYDAKIAGWWVWGISQWIGSGWCARPEWVGRSLPGRANRGVHSERSLAGRQVTSRMGQWKTRPHLTSAGNGVHGKMGSRGLRGPMGRTFGRLPDMGGNSGAFGNGVHASARFTRTAGKNLWLKRPNLGRGTGRGIHRTQVVEKRPLIKANLLDYMQALQDRLRRVRVCCGDWKRILGPSPTTCIGLTAVFLDPPYSRGPGRDAVYNVDDFSVAAEVREWAIAHGEDPKLRIALCGYEGEHAMPRGWREVPWKTNGGYGNQANGRGRANAARERIWFSPHCVGCEGKRPGARPPEGGAPTMEGRGGL